MQPPIAERVPYIHREMNDARHDHYHWLKDRDNPATLAHLMGENDYTQMFLQPSDALQETIYNETLARIQETDQDAPWPYGDYEYYSRTQKGLQYDIFCRRRKNDPEHEEVLFDENISSKGHKYFEVGSYALSLDQKTLALTVDTSGDERYELWIKNLETQTLKKAVLTDIASSLTFSTDNQHLWYCRYDEAQRPYQVWCHDITQSSKDTLCFQEDDEKFWIGIYRSSSDRFLWVQSASKLTTETHYTPADQPRAPLTCFLPREKSHEYDVEDHDNFFYIRSNKNAVNFALKRCPIGENAPESWETVIPHDPAIALGGFTAFKNYLVISARREGLSQLLLLSPENMKQRWIEFPEPAYDVDLDQNWEYDTPALRFVYHSLTTPATVFEYNMDTHDFVVLKQTPVLGGYDARDYVTERIHAKAEDGTLVPISMVYKKSLKKSPMPFYLCGYGAYGIDMDPWFSYSRISLLNRGFGFAIAHIRGGNELGEQWHRDGRLLKKKNSFTDFIACAKALIEQKYTDSEQLYITGGSAGGLLMGAVINMAPELFAGCVAHVPFVDVLNTMLDDTLPLTVTEYEEWGNPNKPEYYDYIKSYSPYDNVTDQAYPAMLVTAGLHDPRVSYWEPAKWVAKLREHNTSRHPILLKTQMTAGHAGQSGRYNAIKEVAEELAFVICHHENLLPHDV